MRSSWGGPRSLARPAMHVIAIFIVSALVLGLPGGAFESAFASNNHCGNGKSQSQNCGTNTATSTTTATKTATSTSTGTATSTATATATATQCNRNNSSNCPDPTPVCNNGQAVGNPHCNTPTATATATSTATATATATKTATATATATSTPKAKIELKKVWVGTAGSTTLKIGTSAGGSQVASQAVSGANGTTGQQQVNAGTYYLSETTPTGTGGTYTSALSCRKDINKNGSIDADDWTITPGSNGSIEVHTSYLYVCTFTNTFVPNPTPTPTSTAPAGGSIRIEKITADDEGELISAGSFTFLVDGVAKTPPVAGGSGQTYSSISAGTHTVTEQAQAGWINRGGILLSALDDEFESCFDILNGGEDDDSENYLTSAYENDDEPGLSQAVDVTVNSGKTVVVCWFNQQDDTPPPPRTGSIRIEKIVYAANGALTSGGSFTFLVDGTTKAPAVTGGSSQTYGAIAVGNRIITEQAQSGWTSLGGATLDELDENSCRSAFEGAPDSEFLSQSVDVSVLADSTAVVCWFNQQTTTPPPPVCEVDCGGGGGETSSESSPPVTPPAAPQVKGSTAQVTKVLSSANPARVGERVTFTVTLTVTGDVPVTGISLVDTYEHAYLRFVGSAPGGCVSSALDAARSQVMCVLGDMTPGTADAAGTKSAVYMLTFDAVAATSRTVDSVVAKADLDGTGPAAPTTIGPATDGVSIINLPTALPKAGDGELVESVSFTTDQVGRLTLASVLLALVAAAAVSLRGSRLWQ